MRSTSIIVVGIALFGAACATLVGNGGKGAATKANDQQDGRSAGSIVQDGSGQGFGSERQGPSLNGEELQGRNVNGLSPNSLSPNGLSPNGLSPNGLSPQGISPNGADPNGHTSQGITPNTGVAQQSTGLKVNTVHVVGGQLFTGDASPRTRAQ